MKTMSISVLLVLVVPSSLLLAQQRFDHLERGDFFAGQQETRTSRKLRFKSWTVHQSRALAEPGSDPSQPSLPPR